MEMIPHRYPMLLVDRIVALEPDVSAVGIKNVSINEPQFQGHFPSMPVMPGVMIVEAMAQTAAILVVQTLGAEAEGRNLVVFNADGAAECPLFSDGFESGDTVAWSSTVQ